MIGDTCIDYVDLQLIAGIDGKLARHGGRDNLAPTCSGEAILLGPSSILRTGDPLEGKAKAVAVHFKGRDGKVSR